MTQNKSDVDLKTLKPLSKAEQKLIDCCKTGQPLVLGSTVPDQATDENSIRGPLIRHLLLGGCKEAHAHAKGVRVRGAYITQALDFEYGDTDQALSLRHCKIAEDLDFTDCRIRSIFLTGSQIEGLHAERAKIEQNLLMRIKFHANGLVNLHEAKIGGQLACDGGQFDKGLDGDTLVVKANVFLSDGFHAKGYVDLRRAEIGGQLACDGGQFDKGLNLQSAIIASAFFWKNVKCAKKLDLTQTSVGVLSDDLPSWRGELKTHMNGFTYQSIESPELGAQERIDWVASHEAFKTPRETALMKAINHVPRKVYQPQPYRQLAQVYDDMGHARSAALVREASEDHRWAYERDKVLAANDGTCAAAFAAFRPALRCFRARLMKWLVGYGHAPMRAVSWAIGIIGFAILFYGWVYSAGQMAPNSDVILTSVDWRLIADVAAHQNPAQIWSDSPAGRDYESFSAIGYGIDLFIPLDALGQENAWAPSKARGDWGWWGFHLRWVIQFSGWVITAVGAATLTGLVGRK